MKILQEFGIGHDEAALLSCPNVRVIYVVGDVDTGKTTLAARIASWCAHSRRTALVDLDAGQATVGLPTTFAWRMVQSRSKLAGMYFTGSTSPVGYLDIWVAGAVLMVSEAGAQAEQVVVDTCGLARGALGCQLHHPIIDAIRANVVVALERWGELRELLCPLGRAHSPAVLRVRPPSAVLKRSRAQRRSYRRARFREYFAEAGAMVLHLDEIELLRWKPDPVGRIASLRGSDGRDVALAIVQAHNVRSRTLTVWTSLQRRSRVRAVVLGSMRIARDGRQLESNV